MMKRMLVVILSLLLCGSVLAQEDIVDRFNVAFSDPSKPGLVDVDLHYGGITVTAYNGDEVVIEARTRSERVDRSNTSEARGMKRIGVTSSELTVEEYNNYMEIEAESQRRAVDITLQVPVNTSLRLSCHHQGEIHVEGVNGIFEVENHHGGITLLGVSGAVLAETHHKDIVVEFKEIYPDAEMSFETYHGKVDVTFPTNAKADVKLVSKAGDVYSDFDVAQVPNPQRRTEENGRSSGGKYRVQIENAFYGAINGGGPMMTFETYHGNIYIRKVK